MPMNRNRYPPDWEEISRRIRFERAQGRCEQCGAPHGKYIIRHNEQPARFLIVHVDGYYNADGEQVYAGDAEDYSDKLTRVVLTTHHIGVPKPDGSPGSPHDKMDCRDENLLALCQRCHFIADHDLHKIAARKAKAAKKRARILASGQLELL